MATVELLQTSPAPQCGHVNTYTCAVLARAEADTDGDARTAAEKEAKTQAKARLDKLKKENSCPAGCPKQGAWGPPNQPTGRTAYSHPDTANNLWVAYATSDWKATLPCKGAAAEAGLELPAQAKELRYSSSPDADAKCEKTTVYSGCVIAHALGADAKEAKEAAEETALRLARKLLEEDKKHRCRDGCDPGVLSASDPQDLTVEQILSAEIHQATDSPHISCVRVAWNATIWCPAKKVAMTEPRRRDGELV